MFSMKKKEVVVSLTTYSRRTETVHKTISSLLNQTVCPDKIILWLDEEEFSKDTIPDELSALQSNIFRVEFCENTKSFKKLIPTLEKYPDATVITFDDDFEYPPTIVEHLLAYNKKYPDCIIGARGRVIRVEDQEIKPYPDWQFIQLEQEIKSKTALLPIGYAGILYPSNSLHQDVFNKSLYQSLCPTADDLWFKAMAMLNNSETVIMPLSASAGMKPIEGTQEDALYLTHNAGDANTKQMRAVVSHYPELQKLIQTSSFSDCSIDGYDFVRSINLKVSNENSGKLESSVKKSVNEIRDAAILLEGKNLILSNVLMKIAHIIRPQGPLINQKLAEYKKKLKK